MTRKSKLYLNFSPLVIELYKIYTYTLISIQILMKIVQGYFI